MGKHRGILTALLALSILAALALLPLGIAVLGDRWQSANPGTADIHTMELTNTTPLPDDPGYMLRKIALEQRMFSLPIKPEQAKMSKDEVLDAATAEMGSYVDADLFAWFDENYLSIEPYIGIDPENKSNNMIFWSITCACNQAPYQYLFLHIDDETGRILFINYETNGVDHRNYADPERQELLIAQFIHIFLGQLDLLDDQNTTPIAQNQQEKAPLDDVTCILYTIEDTRYGTISIEFYITPEGFRVYFPPEQEAA